MFTITRKQPAKRITAGVVITPRRKVVASVAPWQNMATITTITTTVTTATVITRTRTQVSAPRKQAASEAEKSAKEIINKAHMVTEIATKPTLQTGSVPDPLINKASLPVLCLASGLALFVENKRWRAEIAELVMYVLPKGLESLWNMLRGNGLEFKTGEWGEALLAVLVRTMTRLQNTYQNDPQYVSELVRKVLH